VSGGVLEGEFYHPLNEGGEVVADGGGAHGEEAEIGQSGDGVDFQNERAVLGVQPKVYANAAGASEGGGGTEADVADLLAHLVGERSRREIPGFAASILGAVVVKTGAREDFYDLKGLIAENTDRDFAPRNILFGEQAVGVFKSGLDRAREVVGGVHDGNTDTGALVHGLDDERIWNLEDGFKGVLGRKGGPWWGGDAVEVKELLGEDLVHREGTGEDAGAGVGDAGDVQQSLNGAILAEGSVESNEDEVNGVAAEEADEIWNEVAGEVNEENFVTDLAKGGGHGISGAQGDLALRREATTENGNLEELGHRGSFQMGEGVRITGAPEVTRMVCSKWAVGDLSAVNIVQRLLAVRNLEVPIEDITSMARVIPFLRGRPR